MQTDYTIEHEGEDIGSLGVDFLPNHYRLSSLWVHPDHRGKGLARQLLGQAISDADKEDAVLEGRPWGSDEEGSLPREHLESLYRSLGFAPVGEPIERGLHRWMRKPGGMQRPGLAVHAAEGRTTVYHLTDDPRFKLNSNFTPEDNSISINPRDGRRGLYVGRPEEWSSPPYNYKRPYVAELSIPSGSKEGGRWGGENFIPAEHFDATRVERVMPYDHYIRREFGSPGDTEDFSGKTYDTGEPLVKPAGSWMKKYPETIDLKKEIDTRDKRQWSDEQHQQYLLQRRDYLHDVHGWGWNEFDDKGGWNNSDDDVDYDDEGEFIRRDREGNRMTRERRASVNPGLAKFAMPHNPAYLDSLSYELHETDPVTPGAHKIVATGPDGEPHGSVRWWKDKVGMYPGEVSGIWVHPNYRRSGLAYELLRRAKQVSSEKGWLPMTHDPDPLPEGEAMIYGIGDEPGGRVLQHEGSSNEDPLSDLEGLVQGLPAAGDPVQYTVPTKDDIHTLAELGFGRHGGDQPYWLRRHEDKDYMVAPGIDDHWEASTGPHDHWAEGSPDWVYPETHPTFSEMLEHMQVPPRAEPRRPGRMTEFDSGIADPHLQSMSAVDESGLKAAGIAVIAMDTGRVLMQQRALNPVLCPCGQGVTWDEMNGYQHDDGSVSHDDSEMSVSEMLDQGHSTPCPCCNGIGEDNQGGECIACDGSGSDEGSDPCDPQCRDDADMEKKASWDMLHERPEGFNLPDFYRQRGLEVHVNEDDDLAFMREPHNEERNPSFRGLISVQPDYYAEHDENDTADPSHIVGESGSVGSMFDPEDEPCVECWTKHQQTNSKRYHHLATGVHPHEWRGFGDHGNMRFGKEASPDGWGFDRTAALEHDPNEGTWEFPGGKLDSGESPRAAAIREFREEVGQDLPPGVFVGAWLSPGGLTVAASSSPAGSVSATDGDAVLGRVRRGSEREQPHLGSVHEGLTYEAMQPGDQSYGFQDMSGHTAPSDRSYAVPLHNVESMMGGFYDGHHGDYSHGNAGDAESISKILSAHNQPEKKIRIYRAVPHGISKIYGRQELTQMFPEHDPNNLAEWVGISKDYALEHAQSQNCPKCSGRLQVISGVAKAKDLLNEGYPTEWGYVGDDTLEHTGSNKIYKTKCPAPRRVPKTNEQLEAEYDVVKHQGLEAVQQWEKENEHDRMLRLRPRRSRRVGSWSADNDRTNTGGTPTWNELGAFWHKPDEWREWQDRQYDNNTGREIDEEHTIMQPHNMVAWKQMPGIIPGRRDEEWPEGSPRLPSKADQETGVIRPPFDIKDDDENEWLQNAMEKEWWRGDADHPLHHEAAVGWVDPDYLKEFHKYLDHEVGYSPEDFAAMSAEEQRDLADGFGHYIGEDRPRDARYHLDLGGHGHIKVRTGTPGATVRVLRIEKSDGSGPFGYGGSTIQRPYGNDDHPESMYSLLNPYQEDDPDRANAKQRQPYADGIPERYIRGRVFGFLPQHNVNNYFTPRMLRGLHELGYGMSEYDVPGESIVHGRTQTAWRPQDATLVSHKPLTEHFSNLPPKEAAKKSPVYKGFIYLIQHERDIDLSNREHANPDDPDGDMTEQSAWWEIEHAKKNPALRKEVKGIPWSELELWADKSVRSNKQVVAMVSKLAALPSDSQGWRDQFDALTEPLAEQGVGQDDSTWQHVRDTMNDPDAPEEHKDTARKLNDAFAEVDRRGQLAHKWGQDNPGRVALFESHGFKFAPETGSVTFTKTDDNGWQHNIHPDSRQGEYGPGETEDGVGWTITADHPANFGHGLGPDLMRASPGRTATHSARTGHPVTDDDLALQRHRHMLEHSDFISHGWEPGTGNAKGGYVKKDPDGLAQHVAHPHRRMEPTSSGYSPIIHEKPGWFVNTTRFESEHDRVGKTTQVQHPSHLDAILAHQDGPGTPHEAKSKEPEDVRTYSPEDRIKGLTTEDRVRPGDPAAGELWWKYEHKEAASHVAMPMTDDPGTVMSRLPSGEGADTRVVNFPGSGSWVAKSPKARDLRYHVNDEEDREYYTQRAHDFSNMEEFASKLGRALSDPDDEAIAPEVVKSNKATDATPTVYVKKYPVFSDMDRLGSDEDRDHHINTPRGKVLGYYHSVLSDGDKSDYHNMGFVGHGNDVKGLLPVSIDHSHSSIPEYAEALSGNPDYSESRSRWQHDVGEPSPFSTHFLKANQRGNMIRKGSNPLHPDDTPRAVAASETLRPWAKERGIESWLDAAQHRMRLLGEKATGTESMFPYKMAHEMGFQSTSATQKEAAAWVEHGAHPDCGCKIMKLNQMAGNPVQGWVVDHSSHGGRFRWKVTLNGTAQVAGKARNMRHAEGDVLSAYDEVASGLNKESSTTEWWVYA